MLEKEDEVKESGEIKPVIKNVKEIAAGKANPKFFDQTKIENVLIEDVFEPVNKTEEPREISMDILHIYPD